MSYINAIRQVSGAPQVLGGAADIVGYVPVVGGSFSEYLSKAKGAMPPDVSTSEVWALAGAAAGGVVGARHGHWVLGAVGGASIARNAPALLKAHERRYAVCNLMQTGVGVLASLWAKNHPAIGFVLGNLGAGLALHFSGVRK